MYLPHKSEKYFILISPSAEGLGASETLYIYSGFISFASGPGVFHSCRI
jgi:hypothetical protein